MCNMVRCDICQKYRKIEDTCVYCTNCLPESCNPATCLPLARQIKDVERLEAENARLKAVNA
ncbi:hypothetical protein LJC46_10045, partial [Desulfovibrio sp. OttesenSCG-928-G15]|nr:hypothetical protein [Desulfovibrio sp. OttesenSCG-928-G15]